MIKGNWSRWRSAATGHKQSESGGARRALRVDAPGGGGEGPSGGGDGGDGARRQVREDVGLPQRLQMLETQMQMSLCPNAAGKCFF